MTALWVSLIVLICVTITFWCLFGSLWLCGKVGDRFGVWAYYALTSFGAGILCAIITFLAMILSKGEVW